MQLWSPNLVGSRALTVLATIVLAAGGLALASQAASADSTASMTLSGAISVTPATGANGSSGVSVAFGDGVFVSLGSADAPPEEEGVATVSDASQYSVNGTNWLLSG